MTKKRKIAFLINSLSSGGAERVVTTLANSLINNYDVTIITFISLPPFYNLDGRIKLISCYNKIAPSSNPLAALKSNYSLLKRIHSIIKDNNIELLIGFMTTANVLATVIGKINRIPIIISERTNPYYQNIPKFWNFLRSLSYRYADILIVQTEIIKNFFNKKIDEDKLRVLPNPISIELTNKRTLGQLSARKNIVLSVGRLTPLKAHAILIRAFALTEFSDWELWIAGEGPEYNSLKGLIKELNLSDHVKLLGLVKDVHRLYNTSKIFAFSSTYEGFPNALIEAMHFGLACVSMDCPTGPAELIEDGQNGFLVPINDINKMSFKLSSLMIDPSKIEMFGKRSVISARKFEEKYVIEQWTKILNDFLQ
jgi:GalNAc-alpha-(1->4)-GalNAc-alpha-(1->3)-diNAcBac-PP-undecaprenol alpha-1,4-N-acetyl-D-galactosaminyltransferase